MNNRICFSLLCICFLLISCIPPEEIEELSIINARGIDVIEDDLLETTLVVFQFEEQTTSMTKVISGKGKTMKGAAEDANHETNFLLTPGKIKLEVFGKEMAEKGILPYLDTLARDARMADMMYLSVSKTTAKEILSIEEETISVNIGDFLFELIENHTTDHNIPRKTVQDFLRIYYDIGQDNVLPIFSDGDIPKLEAIAIFLGDKYVGEITNKEAVYVNLMDRTVKNQLLELSLPNEPFKPYLEKRENQENKQEIQTGFLITKGSSKTKLIDTENLKFETKTTVQLRLLEETEGVFIEGEHVTKLLEKEIKKKMEKSFKQLLTKLQELEADSFGYGRHYRIKQKNGELSRKEWREKFPKIDVDFQVDAQIIRHGATK